MRTTGGSLSISDFLDRINFVTDNLALAGHSVSEEDLVTIIMQNVGPSFEITVAFAQARDTPITYENLEALLLSSKRRIHEQSQPALDAAPAAFHVAHPRGSGCGFPFGPCGGARGRPFLAGRGSSHNSSAPESILRPVPVRAAAPHPPNSQFSLGGYTPRVVCQICDRPGHSVINCFNRLNLSYEGRMPSKKLSVMAAQRLPSDPSSSTWICDSGANTHITPDVNNIANPSEYHGLDQVGGVGKDLGLPITHIGSSSFSSSSKSLQLNNILHCPTASTNFLSIHQFDVDNHCYFILYPYYFVVRDLKMGMILFKGKCEDGLYPLYLPFKKSSQSSRLISTYFTY